jgi:hypothetical protein
MSALLRCAAAFAVVCASSATTAVRAQTATGSTPVTAAAAAATPASFFTEVTPKIDLRLRMELAHQDGFGGLPGPDEAVSWTGRMRFGLLSGTYRGLQAYVEGEHTEAWSRDSYNAIPGPHDPTDNPLGPPDKSVIADPESNELNQLWLSYASPIGRFKLGRQRIVLDEHRFIGNVGWRQNEQTYDGAVLESKPLPNLDLFYGWIYNVNRIFGSRSDDTPLGAPVRNFDSRSHFAQITYKLSDMAVLRPYAFLLDLRRDGRDRHLVPAADGGSSSTYGANLTGVVPVGEMKFTYRAEYAMQKDASEAPIDFQTNYYHVKLGGTFRGVTLGFAREVLAADDHATRKSTGATTAIGFATPLATLHAFNGFADLFLTTPADGLVDDYAFLNFALPGKVAMELAVHKYRSKFGGRDYGNEFNLVLRRPLPWNMTALVKLAQYRADDQAPNFALRDTFRVIGQLEYRMNP